MELLPVDPLHPDPAIIAHAARILRDGGLVAFPTETVYGLGANALDADAIARIYAAKGRPAWNPVIAHVASMDAARALCSAWPDDATRLAQAFWPGPLTMVLPRGPMVPDIATAGLDAIGVRMPVHPVALALLRATGFPIAAPSANRFTQVSPTTAKHVVASLGDRVDLVLDGGPSAVGIESTVLDLAGEHATLLRPGMLTRAAIEAALGRAVYTAADRPAGATVRADGEEVAAQRSPGMADRHYAPRAEVWLFEASQAPEIAAALLARRDAGITGGVTALLLDTSMPVEGDDILVRMPGDPAAYAQQLYAMLHAADAASSSLVLIERPPARESWSAILDRLTRAAR